MVAATGELQICVEYHNFFRNSKVLISWETVEKPQFGDFVASKYFRGRGVFNSKLVMPAQAGIQKCSGEKAGCPPARA